MNDLLKYGILGFAGYLLYKQFSGSGLSEWAPHPPVIAPPSPTQPQTTYPQPVTITVPPTTSPAQTAAQTVEQINAHTVQVLGPSWEQALEAVAWDPSAAAGVLTEYRAAIDVWNYYRNAYADAHGHEHKAVPAPEDILPAGTDRNAKITVVDYARYLAAHGLSGRRR